MDKQEIAKEIRSKVQEINDLVRELRQMDSLINVEITGGGGRCLFQAKITEEII